jgi:hypothetical protein
MSFGDFEADDSEFYYEGSLPVLAGRFRRKIVGYFDGHVPKGMRTGREIRLVKLPELTWVYGFLMRAKGIGPVLYIKNAALMEGVEGYHPIRSASEIRQSKTAAHPSPSPTQLAHEPAVDSDFDLDFDDLTDLTAPGDLSKVPQTEG